MRPIDSVGGEVVLGTVPSDGSLLLIKTVPATDSDIEPVVYVGPAGDPENAVCVDIGSLDECRLPGSGGAQTVYVRDIDDDETGAGVVYLQNLTDPVGCGPGDTAAVGRRRNGLDRTEVGRPARS